MIFLVSYFVGILLSSVLEWLLHKYPMHHPIFKKFPSYRRHAIMHHQERRSPGKFFVKPEEGHRYIPFITSFMPWIWIGLIPVYYQLYKFCGVIGLGVGLSTLTYLIAYEILHESMHEPDNWIFRNHWWFLWLIEHHRRHHCQPNINYNVVFPFADLILGTLNFRHVKPEPEQVADIGFI